MEQSTKIETFQIWAAVLWGVLGAAVALFALKDVNADARIFVGVSSVLLPGASIAAALAIHRGHQTWAILLLLISVLTPTYFAWALNVIPLLIASSIPLLRSPAGTAL